MTTNNQAAQILKNLPAKVQTLMRQEARAFLANENENEIGTSDVNNEIVSRIISGDFSTNADHYTVIECCVLYTADNLGLTL